MEDTSHPAPYPYHRIRMYGELEDEHRRIWRMAHGSIPKDHVIAFKDGNPDHCVLSNLECTTRDALNKKLYGGKTKGRICTIEGCGRKHEGHGYCNMHLKRLHRTGNPRKRYQAWESKKENDHG